MEKAGLLVIMNLVTLCAFILHGEAIESPEYRVVHSESDIEIRLYQQCFWMTALVSGGNSFEKSTKDGFHRIYQYIHGANLNNSRLLMTAPVVTSMTQTSYLVMFFLPAKYQGSPPVPSPELNLQIQRWRNQCMAIKKFSGFAKEDNIGKEMDSLVTRLSKLLNVKSRDVRYNSIAIAQYNASWHLSGRLNEVWLSASGFAIDGCNGSN